MLFTFLFFSLTASADVRFEAFALKADNSFEVQFAAPTPQVARGVLDNAQRIEIPGAQVTTTVQAQTKSFVIVTLTEQGQNLSEVVILEQLERLKFGRIHHQRIQGASATVHQELDGVFRDLKKQNGWDPTLTIRAMVSYFDEKPGRKIKDFYDAVELGHIRTVARPDTRGKLPPRKAPSKSWGEAPEREPKTTPKRPREPQPWEPRRLPPSAANRTPEWAPWQPPAKNQYPGQRLKPRRPEYSEAPPPRPRQPKTLFDLLFP